MDEMTQTQQKRQKNYIHSNEEFELLMPGYPKGSNITVMNTSYIARHKNEEDKYDPDYIAILFMDNETGAKYTHIIYEPLYTFYVLKDECQVSHNLFFAEKEKTIPVTCKYSDILRAIAQVTGRMDEYKANIDNGNYQENRKLQADPRVLFSDTNIEHYYRFLFNLSYKNEKIATIAKGFMDIETDIRYSNSEFPEPGEVPINAFAYLDERTNTVYQLLYNDKNNPLVEQYKQSIIPEHIEDQLRDFVIESVGGPIKAAKFGVDKLRYRILFFDDELEMIKIMFRIVHKLIPDFIEYWNMAFDMRYIIVRIENLGAEPIDVICDNRIQQQFLRYYIDERNINNYEERGDFFQGSTFTIWTDQMIHFASRRKGRGRYQSFKLDAIGEVVAGVKKLDYSHITSNLGDLPYLDFKTFSFYNVMDVIVQKCIESVTKDLDYVFTKCLVNNTNYAKCHRQSVYLANRFAKEFYDMGYIIGNNKNLWNEKPNTKFPGAMVGDPLHNDPNITIKINDRPTLLINNTVDFDYSSLYPSIILEFNIAPNTQIGKVIIEDPNDPTRAFSTNEHPDMYSSDDSVAKYSRGGEFLENYMCDCPMEFGKRWMGLGDINDVIKDLEEFYRFNGYCGKPLDTDPNAAVWFAPKSKDVGTPAIEFNVYSTPTPVLTFYDLEEGKANELASIVKEVGVL